MLKGYVIPKDFKGSVTTTVSNGLVDFTGELVKRECIDERGSKIVSHLYINQLTFEEYNKLNNNVFRLVSESELDILLREWEENNIISEFSEVSLEKFENSLECLPPLKWVNCDKFESFYVGECYTSNIYSFYIRDKKTNKCFYALRRITESREDLINLLIDKKLV